MVHIDKPFSRSSRTNKYPNHLTEAVAASACLGRSGHLAENAAAEQKIHGGLRKGKIHAELRRK